MTKFVFFFLFSFTNQKKILIYVLSYILTYQFLLWRDNVKHWLQISSKLPLKIAKIFSGEKIIFVIKTDRSKGLRIWYEYELYYCLSRPYPFKFFKRCLPQILLGLFLNTLSHMYASFLSYTRINLFLSNVTFLHPLETPENYRFSDVFRGYRNMTLSTNMG